MGVGFWLARSTVLEPKACDELLFVQVAIEAYAAAPNLLLNYTAALAALSTPGGEASVAGTCRACGMYSVQGVLATITDVVYLDTKITLLNASAADSAQVAAALSHTTAYVLAFRSNGLPNTAAVSLVSGPTFNAIYSPPPPPPSNAAAREGAAAAVALSFALLSLALLQL